jgi:predicted SAM-dependent methyltransferase
VSETAACRHDLARFCTQRYGLDVGAGGDRIVPHAWTLDLYQAYTSVGNERQQLRGDCRSLSFLCDNALDWIYSAHVCEDFYYTELVNVLTEWRRVINIGGLLITNCPDQQRFKKWIAEHSQGDNLAHKEQTFNLANFKKCLDECGPWEEVYEIPDDGRYSFYYVCRKV